MLVNSNRDRVIVQVATTVWVSLLDASENDDVDRLLVEYMKIWGSRIYKNENVLSVVFLSDRRIMIDYSLVFLNRLKHRCLLCSCIKGKRLIGWYG